MIKYYDTYDTYETDMAGMTDKKCVCEKKLKIGLLRRGHNVLGIEYDMAPNVSGQNFI